jgi:hypothetical protein
MALKDKYSELITAARAAKVADLQVTEQNGVLFIDGIAPTEETKQKLIYLYERIHSDSSGDVVLNITIPGRDGQNGQHGQNGQNN